MDHIHKSTRIESSSIRYIAAQSLKVTTISRCSVCNGYLKRVDIFRGRASIGRGEVGIVCN